VGIYEGLEGDVRHSPIEPRNTETLSRYRHACSASSASAKSLHTRNGDKNVFAAQNESDKRQSLIAAQCFLG